MQAGFVVAAFLTAFLIAEIVALVVTAPKHLLSAWSQGDEDIKPEGREYATRAITLGGLSFASVALLVSAFRTSLSQVSDVLVLFVFSLSLFFVSYLVEVHVLRKRIYWVIQDKTLAFGYLGVVVALVLFFNTLLSELLLIAIPAALILFGIHGYEYFQDYSMWKQREDSITSRKSMTDSQSMSLGQAFKIAWKFLLASAALSGLTFGFVGLNRYFDSVWDAAPQAPQVFTVAGQMEWFIVMLIAVLTGAILLGALAVTFPWAVVKGTELKNLWDLIRGKKT